MARLALSLLGGFEARLGAGRPLALPRKTRALLAYLALVAPRACPREELETLLWGATGETQAQQSLRKALWGLRRALGSSHASLVVAGGDTVALGDVEVDVAKFERLAGKHDGGALAEAAALYRGPLLGGVELDELQFDEWLRVRRDRLRELAVNTLGRLLAQQTKMHAVDDALATALKIFALDPVHEPTHRAVMRLHVAAGRRAAALRQYQSCVEGLRRELGVEPEEETRRLYQELLQAPSPRAARVTTRAAARSNPPAAAPLTRQTSGFVGRREELAWLSRHLADARQGTGRVVMVIGQAGIGKSRLLDEFAGEARRSGARMLIGRAHESEQVLAFGPWIDALRAADVGNDETVLASLRPAWRAELARLLPELETPGLPPAGQYSRRLFESILRIVEALAQRQPTIVVLEDVQWADEMTLRLLAFFARQILERRVLVVTTVREEDLPVTPALARVVDELRREPNLEARTLAPFLRDETLELVRALAKTGAGDEVARRVGEQVWRASEGNAFVIVETMRAMAEDAASSQPPFAERVRQLVVGRLARLSARARRLVTVAAVVGREFDFTLLSRAAGAPEVEVAEDLEELVRRGILHGVGDSLDFTHQRVREVAYRDILDARRRILHVQVAQVIEQLHQAELAPQYAALGTHYREGESWERAQHYLRLAGA